MYPNNFKVMRLDGTIFDLETLEIIVNSLEIESPSPIHYREKIEGRDGDIDLGTDFGPRNIKAAMTMNATDNSEFSSLRSDVFRLFDSGQPFYILIDELPDKRLLVKNDSPYPIKRMATLGEFSVSFISSNAYFETMESTLTMVLGQISGNKIQKYKHTTPIFEVLNEGDKTVNPRRYPIIIEFKGASTNLQIKNLTTGDTWTYTGTTTASDSIKLDGIRSTKNGLSIFRDTNRKLISLAPGWNEFELVGSSGTIEISFDFRFYTL